MLKQDLLSPVLPAQSVVGPGDVTSDICNGEKIRAVNRSICETHLRQPYTPEVSGAKLEPRLYQLQHQVLYQCESSVKIFRT